ncbi:glycosyltransferase family 4 protein [Plantibacter sp. ME-Dv--P-095]|uniref:glycosyltransferase family 4 protein n=1 Tax=Plantibacter sp. ME-Dv--P-095 TaxID=3040299 RepID=UPI00254D2C24|nr:glycosyltransferase family 4 protein [Plantibacter sp. ME-Dv--P-095]
MRIAVVHWGRTGAGPLFAQELAQALQEDGASIVVSYSLDAEIAERFTGLGVPAFGVRTYRDRRGALLGLPRLLVATVGLDRFLRRHRVDVVVIAMEHLWQGVVAPVFRLGRRRTLLCVHDATMHPGDHSGIEHLLRRVERGVADGAVVFSNAVAAQLASLGAFPTDRIHETVHAAYRVDPGRAARTVGSSEVPVVGFFGRLSAYKGLDLGIRAIAELRSRGIRVRFRVVGSGADESVAALRHEDDEVQNRWVAQDEIEGVVGGFDLALLPYTEASQSGVLAYTMALGVPAVVTPVGGLAEQATASGSAIVATNVTPTALADAMASVLTDEEFARALSEAGRAAASGSMSWARVAADVRQAATVVSRR